MNGKTTYILPIYIKEMIDRLRSNISLLPEIEEGNIEYKRKLCNISDWRKERLTSQMRWRLDEGGGRAIYIIGVEDNGTIYGLNSDQTYESINNMKTIIELLQASIILFEMIITDKGSVLYYEIGLDITNQ